MGKSNNITPKEFFNLFSEFGKEALYFVDYTNEFKQNIKLSYKRNLNLSLISNVIKILAKGGTLPPEYKAHPLRGYKKKANEEVMECHIQPDWLLVWLQNDNELTLLLTNTGTHSDLF